MWKLEMHVKMLEMGMKATAKDFRMHVFVGHGMVEWLYVLNELKGACVDLNVHVGECEGNACEDANK